MSNDAIMSGHSKLKDFYAKFETPKTDWKNHPADSEGPDDDSQAVCDGDLSITAMDDNPEGHNQWTGAEHQQRAERLLRHAAETKDQSSSMHSAIAASHRNAQQSFKKEGNYERMKYNAEHASTHERLAQAAVNREHDAKFGGKR
jgi:hypothetical protein